MQDKEIWHNKWLNNQIGFHLNEVNPLLIRHWARLQPQREGKVFVPLCGKSEDLVWLAQQHNEVTGVELSHIAVKAFFSEHLYTPRVTALNAEHELYQFDEIAIYTGDFFTAPLSSYQYIYDRAALIAMPPELRTDYVARLKSLLQPQGKILLISLDYDQQEMQGPPFSLPHHEIMQLFPGDTVTKLEAVEADKNQPRKQQLSRFVEEVWLIEPSD